MMATTLSVNLGKISHTANIGIVVLMVVAGLAGHFVSFYFHFLTVTFFLVTLLNLHRRYVIAVIELVAALLLLSPFAAGGAVLVVGVMCGAIIAHLTQLGLVVNGDGGMSVGMLVMTLLSSSFVLSSRRKDIPFVGEAL